MKKVDFNEGWQVRNVSLDGEFSEVKLPHDAMLSEPRSLSSRGEGNIGWYEGYDYEYEKYFNIDKKDLEGCHIFEFEGVFQKAKVYINDKEAMFRPYGYTNFFIKADEFLVEGENKILVEAHNSEQPNSRWYTGTGIYRPVWLWTSETYRFIPSNGIKIKTVDYKEGKVNVEVKVSGAGEVSLDIMDGDECVYSATRAARKRKVIFEVKIENAKLWSCDNPNMYEAKITYGKDTACEKFGIRGLEWGPKKGITINGERVILRGACIHHDNGPLGACTYPEAELRRVRLLKKAGYNAIRSAHNPCSKYLLDACDAEGVLVMDEYIDHWYIHKTKYDYVDYMPKWWKKDLHDMVDKDFNHPSVIMYSTGNEVAETGEKRGIRWQRGMTDFLHELDDSRMVSCGINIFFNFLYSIGLGVYSDDKADAEEAAAKDADKGNKKAPVGSEFYNMLAVKLGDKFMKFGATLYPCDLKTKGAYDAMDVAGYNYGIWRYKKDMKKYPNRLILGSETFCKDEWLFWDIAKDNPQIVGDFVWSGMDYIGETGMGAAEYATYDMSDRQDTCMTGGNGRIDITGKLRAEAYYTLVALDQAKGPFLAASPAYEDKKPPVTGWMLTKAIRSWSFDDIPGATSTVEVYARAAEVEVLLNGASIGRKKVNKTFRTLFEVPYERGNLVAISYDEFGDEIGRDKLTSASDESVIRVEPEVKSAKKDEIVYVRIRYADEDGITRVMDRHKISAEVKGGELMALCSANPYVEGNYTDSETDTYYGEALAVVRADGSKKDIELVVSDDDGKKTEEIIKVI